MHVHVGLSILHLVEMCVLTTDHKSPVLETARFWKAEHKHYSQYKIMILCLDYTRPSSTISTKTTTTNTNTRTKTLTIAPEMSQPRTSTSMSSVRHSSRSSNASRTEPSTTTTTGTLTTNSSSSSAGSQGQICSHCVYYIMPLRAATFQLCDLNDAVVMWKSSMEYIYNSNQTTQA